MKTLQHLPQKISILFVVVELVSAGRITWYCSSERKIRILGLIERCKTEWDISIHMSNCLVPTLCYVVKKYHLRSKVATTFSRRDATTDMSAAWRGSGHNDYHYYHCYHQDLKLHSHEQIQHKYLKTQLALCMSISQL